MRFFWLIILIAALGACKKETKPKTQGVYLRTPSGYDYFQFKKGEGRKIVEGEVAVYNVVEIMDDTVVVNSSYRDRQLRYNFVITAGQMDPKVGPIMEVIRELSIGDSVTVRFTPAMLNIPTEAFNFNHLDYYIKLENIISKKEYDAQVADAQKAFEMRLDSIKQREPLARSTLLAAVKDWKGSLAAQLKTIPTGDIQYLIHEEGDGLAPLPGEFIRVHFAGAFADGSIFDNSFQSGMPFGFKLGAGEVVPGWDRFFGNINKGSKITVLIPASLAYGAAGSPPAIPPNADLFFYLEIEK